jgi:hypothetical protein
MKDAIIALGKDDDPIPRALQASAVPALPADGLSPSAFLRT